MSLDPVVLVAILAMAAASYGNRAGGYLLFRAFKPGPGLRAMLGYVPGTLFVAYVTPALLAGGLHQWAGAAAAVAIMVATRQAVLAIFGGTGLAWLVWAFS